MMLDAGELSPALQENIRGISVDGFKQMHMPVFIYIKEMSEKAVLLRAHRDLISSRLRFDVSQLADEIDAVKDALLNREVLWIESKKNSDKRNRFWYTCKKRLKKLNPELKSRLEFHFYMNGNRAALKRLESITVSSENNDIIDAASKFVLLITDYFTELVETLYSSDELNEYIEFYKSLEPAFAFTDFQRSASKPERILRDKTFLYLRSLEKTMRKVVKAAFVHERETLSCYASEYTRQKNRKRRDT